MVSLLRVYVFTFRVELPRPGSMGEAGGVGGLGGGPFARHARTDPLPPPDKKIPFPLSDEKKREKL